MESIRAYGPDIRTALAKTIPMEDDRPFRIYTAQSLGVAIKHYRHLSGLTQAELAVRTGLNRTYLSSLEQGRETEQVRRLFRVLRELGVRMTLQEADW